jgi:tetratricopeptide (TPR) repeat protein
MTITDKARRRLIIGVTMTLIVAAMVVAVYAVHRFRVHQWHSRLIREGMEALDSGDYRKAIRRLASYIVPHPTDRHAVVALARARYLARVDDERNVYEAIALLTPLVDRSPDDHEAAMLLLQAHQAAAHPEDVLQLTGRMLRQWRDDPEIWRARAIANGSLQQYEQALHDAIQCSELIPRDIDARVLVLFLLHRMHSKDSGIVELASGWRTQFADDPRFDLTYAIACRIVGDAAAVDEALTLAMSRSAPDATFVLMLMQQLDITGRYHDAFEVLDRAEVRLGDIRVRRALVRRLWQLNHHRELARRLSHLDIDSSTTDAELMGFLAMSLRALGEHERAELIAERLDARKDQQLPARAWSELLRPWRRPDVPIAERIIFCRRALLTDSDHPQFHRWLGEAWEAAGEHVLAMHAWRKASELAPSWPDPPLAIATLALAQGDSVAALSAAKLAADRAPDHAHAVAALAIASLRSAGDRPTHDQRMRWLKVIEAGAATDPTLVPARIELLASGERADAIAALGNVLRSSASLPPSSLLDLARLSRRLELGLASQCFDRYRHAYGVTGELAYEMAASIAGAETDPTTMIHAFDRIIHASNHRADHASAVMRARMLEKAADPRAGTTWVELADQHSEDLSLQRLAVDARSTQNDPAFRDRAIARIQNLTTDDGLTWRVHRARWRLYAGGTNANVVEAATLLHQAIRLAPDYAQAHALLAECLFAIGSTAAAIDRLEVAVGHDPTNVGYRDRLNELRGSGVAIP